MIPTLHLVAPGICLYVRMCSFSRIVVQGGISFQLLTACACAAAHTHALTRQVHKIQKAKSKKFIYFGNNLCPLRLVHLSQQFLPWSGTAKLPFLPFSFFFYICRHVSSGLDTQTWLGKHLRRNEGMDRTLIRIRRGVFQYFCPLGS
jgi:hypothetical protein